MKEMVGCNVLSDACCTAHVALGAILSTKSVLYLLSVMDFLSEVWWTPDPRDYIVGVIA